MRETCGGAVSKISNATAPSRALAAISKSETANAGGRTTAQHPAPLSTATQSAIRWSSGAGRCVHSTTTRASALLPEKSGCSMKRSSTRCFDASATRHFAAPAFKQFVPTECMSNVAPVASRRHRLNASILSARSSNASNIPDAASPALIRSRARSNTPSSASFGRSAATWSTARSQILSATELVGSDRAKKRTKAAGSGALFASDTANNALIRCGKRWTRSHTRAVSGTVMFSSATEAASRSTTQHVASLNSASSLSFSATIFINNRADACPVRKGWTPVELIRSTTVCTTSMSPVAHASASG
mmetsp:Transcript_5125/g.16253  ORF Transcript_5125/g.16253 Transcript_5125/m.16253 type:complete len:304 (+) Transcript_5125:127-1038(+)